MTEEQAMRVIETLREKGKRNFSSHNFIKKYAELYQREYITMLWDKRDAVSPFQTVHSQIGLELERMQDCCGFEKDGRVSSENIFGNSDEVQNWRLT